jgi:hypothetical protein
MGGSSSRVASPAEAQGGGAGKGNSKAGPNKSAHIRVGAVPFGGKEGGKLAAGGSSFSAAKAVNRKHKRGEVAAALKAGSKVFLLLGLLVGGQDFFRVLVAVGGRIRVGDADVEHRRPAAVPETMGGDIAPGIWGDFCAAAIGAPMQSPTMVD